MLSPAGIRVTRTNVEGPAPSGRIWRRQGDADVQEMNRSEWLYRYKKKVIIGIIGVISLSVVLTMFFIARTLRNHLLADSKANTLEVSEVIESSLRSLMLVRNSQSIQEALEVIGKRDSSIVKAFILDKTGKVVYSSKKNEIDTVIDRFHDGSCKGCHTGPVAVPRETTTVISVDGQEVLRNVNIIYNEKTCHGCHAASDRINGKMIIDRSIQPTYALITHIELMLALSAGLCLVILVPLLSRLLSRWVDTYIKEILTRSTELSMLYMMVERLSKTIEMEELKRAVVATISELFNADEIHIILPHEARVYSGVVWKKSDNSIERGLAPDEDPDRDIVFSWLRGEQDELRISSDKKEVSMPIAKGQNRLALIIIRKQDGIINVLGLDLVKAMGAHIAAAFENASLYRMAITDELTGLYSKRHFHTMIEKKFALYEQYGEKLTLLMIDADNFKQINDTYGHPAGDQVLREVARCIVRSTREQDFDFRYGGEEFSVLLPATDGASGKFVAERIRELIQRTAFTAGETTVNMTVSIGVASCPANAQTIRALVVEADKALYEAKRAGKNQVVPSRAEPSGTASSES
jgi:diguanylate cyclase (GGDEF)-like protein